MNPTLTDLIEELNKSEVKLFSDSNYDTRNTKSLVYKISTSDYKVYHNGILIAEFNFPESSLKKYNSITL
jgi:hypothetical protein